MPNAFAALALTDSEDEAPATPVVTTPVKVKVKAKPTRVAITRPAPATTTPDHRPPPASTNAPHRPVYRRNAKGQLVNATTGEVLTVGSRPKPQSAPAPKMDAFPALGKSKPSGSTPAIRMGAWGAGIKAVVAAKDLPDPEIARRKAAEERRMWLKRQQAANMTTVSYYDSEDEEPPMYDDGPTDEELIAMREAEEHERHMKWDQMHDAQFPEPEFTAEEQAAIAQYEQEQQDDWW